MSGERARGPQRRADGPPAPYAELLALVEAQSEHTRRGELGASLGWRERWEELVARAPAAPPQAAAALLARAAAVQEGTRAQLLRLQAALRQDIATVAQARRAARGSDAEQKRSPRVNRSA